MAVVVVYRIPTPGWVEDAFDPGHTRVLLRELDHSWDRSDIEMKSRVWSWLPLPFEAVAWDALIFQRKGMLTV